jgi:uncharacterized protein YndB with AHSA1/START domain
MRWINFWPRKKPVNPESSPRRIMSTTNPPPSLRLSKTFRATRQEVFNAWINPESFKRWMSPGDVVVTYLEIDVRVGGGLRIDMQSGHNVVVHTGVYQIVDPPAKLAFTWRSPTTLGTETLVTVELFERGPRQTELVLTHQQLPNAEARQAHEQGWQSILDKLHFHLSSKAKGG